MGQPDRTSLPIRRETFAGVANRTLNGSKPDWNLIGHPSPPEGAPNVLLVLIDDAGFGNPSTFGGPIQTPTFTRMAEGGLRYNRFHVTALCSPTRAALLTGRNNHAVDTVEPAVTLAIEKVVGQAEGGHVQAFKGALTDVKEKMAEGGAQG